MKLSVLSRINLVPLMNVNLSHLKKKMFHEEKNVQSLVRGGPRILSLGIQKL